MNTYRALQWAKNPHKPPKTKTTSTHQKETWKLTAHHQGSLFQRGTEVIPSLPDWWLPSHFILSRQGEHVYEELTQTLQVLVWMREQRRKEKEKKDSPCLSFRYPLLTNKVLHNIFALHYHLLNVIRFLIISAPFNVFFISYVIVHTTEKAGFINFI